MYSTLKFYFLVAVDIISLIFKNQKYTCTLRVFSKNIIPITDLLHTIRMCYIIHYKTIFFKEKYKFLKTFSD